jgi:Glycosyl transferase family 2
MVSSDTSRDQRRAPTAASIEVSVICTAKNAASTIGGTIKSILAQDFPSWEMIIVDDGSTDDTAAIVRGFASADPRIRFVATPGIGRGPALNLAVAGAGADLIANIDADDESHPSRLRCQLAAMERYPQFPFMFAEAIRIHGAAEPVWPRIDANASLAVEDVTTGLTLRNPVRHSSAMMRKTVLVGLGGYDEARRFVFDYDLWVRAAAAGLRLGRVELPLVAKRLHAGQFYAHSMTFSRSFASAQIQLRAIRVLGGGSRHLPVVALRLLWGCLPPSAKAVLGKFSAGRRLGRPAG